MASKVRLYRAEFYDAPPTGQAVGARYLHSATIVGFWENLVDAFQHSHRNYYRVEIFDAVTDKWIAGPLAPLALMPDTDQRRNNRDQTANNQTP